ncbi:hypothetical protein PoB_003826000 [Plakobranchus ocellatus]|uniref:Uncharacterized protein n=1 Tax=Plakobranchus ocellatus TaxID=259542 RepID=A0AAV4ATU0_9GAST|nr:hypothetical protein PoB_003826000 [Plakobranchus ocellatus]
MNLGETLTWKDTLDSMSPFFRQNAGRCVTHVRKIDVDAAWLCGQIVAQHTETTWSLDLYKQKNFSLRRRLKFLAVNLRNTRKMFSRSSRLTGVGGTVDSESALRSAETLLFRVRALLPTP